MERKYHETSLSGIDRLPCGETLYLDLQNVIIKGLVIGDGVYNGHVHDPEDPSKTTPIVGPRRINPSELEGEETILDTERDFGAEASILKTAYELGRMINLRACLNEAVDRLEILAVNP